MASVVGAAGQAFFSKVEQTAEHELLEVQEGPVKARKIISTLKAARSLNEPNPKVPTQLST